MFHGRCPTGIVAVMARLAASITETQAVAMCTPLKTSYTRGKARREVLRPGAARDRCRQEPRGIVVTRLPSGCTAMLVAAHVVDIASRKATGVIALGEFER